MNLVITVITKMGPIAIYNNYNLTGSRFINDFWFLIKSTYISDVARVGVAYFMMAWLMKWLFDPGNTQTNSPDDIQKDGASSQETSNDIKRYKIDKCYALLTGADINPSSRTSLPTLGFVHKDLQRMNNVLRELGFDVSNPCLGRETDVSREFLFDKCINNPSRDLAQSCSLFYFSGHGDKEKVLLSNGESATYVDIILNFNCSSADAPRIFIFDCCCDAPSEGVTPELSLLDNIQPHVLVVFACMPDDITYGNKKNGSYFTHKLENRLRAFVNELSFVEIILQVTGTEVIKEGTRQREYELNPFVVCSLRQQLHFGGSKLNTVLVCVCVCVCVCV